MNKNNALSKDDHLESPLSEAVEAICATSVSDEAVERSVNRALQLASPAVRSKNPSRLRLRQWLVIAPCVAALLAIAVWWSQSSGYALADVVKAVAKKPWLHATGKGPNDIDVEMWYSPTNGIVASRQGKQVLFANIRQETFDFYSNKKGETPLLSRLPIEKKDMKRFASQKQILETLFFGNPSNAFQGGLQKLVSHTQKTIQDGDQTLIEHRFTTKVENQEQQMVTVLRVNAESQLPVSWKSMIGKMSVFSGKVDFPDHGPQTIYAMGIPRDMKIVDQTPSDDLKKILAALKTGRTRFDSYRAVVVYSSSADPRLSGADVYQVWRKGLKWRVEDLRRPITYPPKGGRITDGPNTKEWWLKRGEILEAIPKIVSDGTREISLHPIFGESDKFGRRPITSFEPHRTNAFVSSSTDPRPPAFYGEMLPEFQAYPFLQGAKSWSYKTTLDPHPDNGPAGTVLYESHGKSSGARYWMDPARGYVVSQMQWLTPGQPETTQKGRVEFKNFAMSPNGFWYPTVVRQLQNGVSMEDGTTSDTYFGFYLDFEAEIPDELFDTHEWGPVK